MPYVVKKGQYYASKPGMHNSYTTNPLNARTFDTQEEAERDCCGNESVFFMSEFHETPCARKAGNEEKED